MEFRSPFWAYRREAFYALLLIVGVAAASHRGWDVARIALGVLFGGPAIIFVCLLIQRAFFRLIVTPDRIIYRVRETVTVFFADVQRAEFISTYQAERAGAVRVRLALRDGTTRVLDMVHFSRRAARAVHQALLDFRIPIASANTFAVNEIHGGPPVEAVAPGDLETGITRLPGVVRTSDDLPDDLSTVLRHDFIPTLSELAKAAVTPIFIWLIMLPLAAAAGAGDPETGLIVGLFSAAFAAAMFLIAGYHRLSVQTDLVIYRTWRSRRQVRLEDVERILIGDLALMTLATRGGWPLEIPMTVFPTRAYALLVARLEERGIGVEIITDSAAGRRRIAEIQSEARTLYANRRTQV